MSDTHGVAIICEREAGHTVAWVDDRMSRKVPAGYFVEWWMDVHEAFAGTLDGGYFKSLTWPHKSEMPVMEKLCWRNWRDTVMWCEAQARKERAA
jgi:hypothetical protein